MEIIALTRPGFERDASLEWTVAERTQVKKGYVAVGLQGQGPELEDLCFTRSYFYQTAKLDDLVEGQWADPIAEALWKSLPSVLDESTSTVKKLYSALWVYGPDTEEGKKLSKFCQSLTPVIERKLQKLGARKVFTSFKFPILHVFLENYEGAVCGIAKVHECGPWMGGIPRLKQSASAPSRSALKLEEAIVTLMDRDHRDEMAPGASAIDLGAAPGGWTSVLLKRGVFVTGVDHAAMDEQIMKSENFVHSKQDAFKYKPKQPTDFLVCDVVENPYRIADLVLDWSRNGYFKTAIVNLKLPMGRRFEAIQEIKERWSTVRRAHIRFKHLYHDRDEVTALFWKP